MPKRKILLKPTVDKLVLELRHTSIAGYKILVQLQGSRSHAISGTYLDYGPYPDHNEAQQKYEIITKKIARGEYVIELTGGNRFNFRLTHS